MHLHMKRLHAVVSEYSGLGFTLKRVATEFGNFARGIIFVGWAYLRRIVVSVRVCSRVTAEGSRGG